MRRSISTGFNHVRVRIAKRYLPGGARITTEVEPQGASELLGRARIAKATVLAHGL